jgi:hypothetical protein
MEERGLRALDRKIQDLKQTAQELQTMGAGIPSVERNVVRILASIKMLELNVSDILGT